MRGVWGSDATHCDAFQAGRYAVPKHVGMRLVQVVGVLRQSHRRGLRLSLVQGVPVSPERRLIRLVAELDHYPRYLAREAAIEALYVLRRVNWLPRWERPAKP